MAPRRLTFLNFHGLGEPPASVPPAERRYWVPVDEYEHYLDFAAGREDVRITFDDGLASDLHLGLPRLVERGLQASFFVLAGRIGAAGHLHEDEVRDLARAGMTVGSHGMDHRPWPAQHGDELERELVEARARLEEVVGESVDEAACPFGAYDARVLGRLKSLGYRRVYTSDGGRARPAEWLVGRNTITCETDRARVEHIADGREGLVERGRRSLKTFVKRRR